MTEEDRMKYLDKIEKIAVVCGFEHKRENFRSLEVIMIVDPISKQWILFDPVHQGKDVSKMMWSLAREKDDFTGQETEFRLKLIDHIISIYS